jgi:DNA replication protein DnaC
MMVNEATIQHLHEMRLSGMAGTYRSQNDDPSLKDLSFDERFGLMVDTEWSNRKNNKLSRLISRAGFPQQACVENIEYHADRKLDREQIHHLATCEYINRKHNIIILGASGAGKSYLCCAFGLAACRHFHTVKYIRLPDLLNDLAVARGEGLYRKVISSFEKVNLLILDEWLLMPLRENETRDLLEIVELRHKKGSIIFASQFSPEGWHDKIGEGPLADAILDRIIYDSYRIVVDGEESMRKKKGIA